MKYHPYGNIDPYVNPKAADKVLNEYCDVVESMGNKAFLYYGTCLGIVRDGGYIIGDTDIDVGFLGRHAEEFAARMEKAGFEKKRRLKGHWHFLKYGILIDVYYNFRDMKFLQPLGKIKYNGRLYGVPHPVEKYLEARYGDWKTKRHRKEWKG